MFRFIYFIINQICDPLALISNLFNKLIQTVIKKNIIFSHYWLFQIHICKLS